VTFSTREAALKLLANHKPLFLAGFPTYAVTALSSDTPPAPAMVPVVISLAEALNLSSSSPSSAGGGGSSGKLFVGCLPYSKSAADLEGLFGVYGPLLEVALLSTAEGKSKGAAFVTFEQFAHAVRAQTQLNGYVFPNSTRPINVSLATNQRWRPPPPLAKDQLPPGSATELSPTSRNLQSLLQSLIHFDDPAAPPPGFE
jgi:hypothetical protein